MELYYVEEVNRILPVLSDISRIECLKLLCQGKSPAEIAKGLGKQRSTIQRYIETFRNAKLVSEEGKTTKRATAVVSIMERMVHEVDRELGSIKKEELPTTFRVALEELLREAPKLAIFDDEQMTKLRETKKLLERVQTAGEVVRP